MTCENASLGNGERMTTSRLRALSAALTLTVASSAMVGLAQAPASAGWTTATTVHDARLLVCRTADGDAVRFRLNNKQGRHSHRGGLFRERGKTSTYVGVQAAKGRMSKTRQFPVRPGDGLVTLVGEINGPAAGGGLPLSALPRC